MMGRNNCTCQGERSKAQLMETIGQSAFAAYDTLLYMDTHPQDQEAMAYYHKQAGIRREAMEEYARRFGPLTMDLIDETDCHSWEWMMQPWPWERSGKGRCQCMWIYEKRLQYPVNITKTDAGIAKIIASQYGGPDGEIGASMRYLSQRFTAPNRVCMAVLTDVATEELGHLEMVSTIVHQLTANLTVEEIENQGFADYYVDHTTGIYPDAASGTPGSADTIQSTGDPITDLMENMAAEQKARTTYDNILRLVKDDPDVYDAIKFLRAREIVHFQRFGESLRIVQDNLNSKNFYAFNPAFDNKKC